MQEDQASMIPSLLAWQFLPYDHRLRKPLPDGSRPVITEGWTFKANDPREAMSQRLQSFDSVLDAFRFGGGFIACRTRLSGDIRCMGKTKRLFATEFRIEWMCDVTRTLHTFVCDVAERLLLRERLAGREPDPVFWMALIIKRAWIAGEIDRDRLHQLSRSPFSAYQSAIKAIAGEPPSPGHEWAIWWQTAEKIYEATPEGATARAAMWATNPNGRIIEKARSARVVRRAMTSALAAAVIQRDAWTPRDEAVVVAAGLDMHPDSLSTELETRLHVACFPVN